MASRLKQSSEAVPGTQKADMGPGVASSGVASSDLASSDNVPSSEIMLEAVLRYGRELFSDFSEGRAAENLLSLLGEVFPGRLFALRIWDVVGDAELRVYANESEVRAHLGKGRIYLRSSAVTRTKLSDAVRASAFLHESERWDSPFPGIASGFCIPLAAAGELYGVLDVGYPLGTDLSESDQTQMLVLANQLAAALRSESLSLESKSLRDYQSQLIEHASALILGIDSAWRIRVCNKALCDLVGISSSELIGEDLRDHFPVANPANLQSLFADGLRGVDSALGETQILTRAGGTVSVVWRLASIRNRGKIQALVAIGQDQTVMSSLQNQLVQAEKMSTLGQIAAGVVHELNNPLTAISVYSEFLLRKTLERDGAEAKDEASKLRTIQEGAERIQHFVRDLMQYARPSAGVPKRLSINKVINQSLVFCEHLFSEDGVVLQRDLDSSIPDVQAVPGQLEQVVINLVTNAVQACGDSGSVEIRSYLEDSKVIFSVRDEGPGISEENQVKIFEPFFTTKADGQGTGLGLCIVRNIMEENRGELVLDSSLGEGSEFRCAVPVFTSQ